MSKLTRDLFRPYIDANLGAGDAYDWVRIDKSTVFALEFNPEEETYGYIDSANDTTEVTSYAPTMEQEIILDSSNAAYQLLFEFCMGMPTGSSAVVPVLLTMPDAAGGETYTGYLWADATITPGSLDTVDGKLSVTLNLNGSVEVGTATFATDGTVTFAAAA